MLSNCDNIVVAIIMVSLFRTYKNRRNQARRGNYNLNKTAINSGVKNLAGVYNAGYKGLYNGMILLKEKV